MKDQTCNQETAESSSSSPMCQATLSQAQPAVNRDELRLKEARKSLLLFFKITIIGAIILACFPLYNLIRSASGGYESHNDPIAFLFPLYGGGMLLVGAIASTCLLLRYLLMKAKTAISRKPPITPQ